MRSTRSSPGRVKMYACGPTVYRYAHLGNLRSFMLYDLIRRALELEGFEVDRGDEHHRRRAHDRRVLRRGRRQDAARDRGRGAHPAGDRREVHGGGVRRRDGARHPARRPLPEGDRAHPGDARPHRDAHRQGPRLRRGQRLASTTTSRASRATASSPATPWRTSGRGTATSRPTRASATRPTSRCGRPRAPAG